MVTKKADLPTKLCAACQRPFAWRKKWERCWEEVRFCSERCRNSRAASHKFEVACSRVSHTS
ncbi:DUF2256 domain-containing protein [Agrobacterium vitis]|uniref:DUF2256 domain-containing protein n=1 Tax=Agrobacterium vitis TaxID=373 RepID=A0ABD6GEV3_AGRVI|nr:DUF2256 domain-containing protein [Agrobacterium vitis]MUO97107.1 DUF2256 domain-containing protein [Agrobacterium vitis]MUP06378.1 DUF2256 domain-containing protein [Agrobacterium vitis]MUZ83982.1 DUF2256 domain-containing protein [Agrobacterium vitis]MVA10663.1 DUF2256 domain-containing protein [Agrobacterium vitis]